LVLTTRYRHPAAAGRKTLWPLLLLAAVFVLSCRQADAPVHEAGHEHTDASTIATGRTDGGVRRIILVSIDTVRSRNLGVYGHAAPTSPNVDALARGGVVFDDASTTAPWTGPAHASMLTGLYPSQAGVRHVMDKPRPDVETVAERLRSTGYETAGVVNIDFLKPVLGLDRGFDHWDYVEPKRGHVGVAPRVTELAIAALERAADRRLFLFVHYFDAHSAYGARPEVEAMFLPADFRKHARIVGTSEQLGRMSTFALVETPAELADLQKLYDAGLRGLDESLGRLFDYVAERFGFDDTLIILTSDHGEAFREHWLLSHGHSHFQEEIHVPLILRGAGVPSGLRIPSPVSTIDIAPTILAAAGADAPSARPGLDLRRYFPQSGPPPEERVIYSQCAPALDGDWLRAVRRGRFKLIENSQNGSMQLFDLTNDPGERIDLAAERPDLAAELDGLLEGFALANDRDEGSGAPAIDSATRERLRALGYVPATEAPSEAATAERSAPATDLR
jgi:arylsulfatase A-like enzyme